MANTVIVEENGSIATDRASKKGHLKWHSLDFPNTKREDSVNTYVI